MKQYILYTLLVFILFSCKADKKTTSSSLENTVILDTLKTQQQENHGFKTLKEKLVGEIYKGGQKIRELSKYPNQGVFHIGSVQDSPRYTSITFKKDNGVKIILFLRVDNEDLNEALIIDLLEIEKETDVYEKYPNKDIDIFSDVLLNNKRVPELIALAVYEEAEEISEVYKVWRANRKTGKFEEITDLSGITVINEDF